MNCEGSNPCDVCPAKNRASGCDNCALDHQSMQYECGNDECMLNYELGCLLGLDEVCKASDCYEDDYRDHDCSECENFEDWKDADGVPIHICSLTHEEVGSYDTACSSFTERSET